MGAMRSWSLSLLLLLLSGGVMSRALPSPAAAGGGADSISLDGSWEFEADPDNVGAAERWFSTAARPKLERAIKSPGAWQAQGVGNETALETHQYEGVGWYRKVVDLSLAGNSGLRAVASNGGTSAYLWIGGAPGGVMRSANVFANGVHCGRHVGYLEPLEIELTQALRGAAAGDADKLVIAVAVDSRWNRTEDPLWGGGSMWNQGGPGSGGGAGAHVPTVPASAGDGYSFGGYGGMIGHAKVLVRQRAWLEDSVHVACKDILSSSSGDWQCSVKFALVGRFSAADRVSLTVCESSGAGGCTRWGAPIFREVEVGVSSSSSGSTSPRMAITVTIWDAKLWVPGTKAAQTSLYFANLTLRSGGNDGLSAQRSTRFGVRSLSTDGNRIRMNGEPLFLRGYGDDGQYAFTGAPPMDRQYYMAQLTGMKKLGYNFIRFHTHSMPDVFHEVADELGFLCDPEFAMNYKYPCPFPGCVVTDQVHQTFNRSFASIVQRTSHHPSLFGYVLSNEIGFGASDPGRLQFVELCESNTAPFSR